MELTSEQEDMLRNDVCPDCGGSLDTGYECNRCQRDWIEEAKKAWTPKGPKNRIAVLHHADADGWGSAFAAWWHFTACEKDEEPELLFLPVQYGEEPPFEALQAFAPNEVMILDFSYPADTLRRFTELFGEWVTVIDHHKTALEQLEAWGGKYCFDLTHSGAVLTWDSLNREGTPAPDILLYVQDRDLWKFELEHSKEINAFIATLPWEFGVWNDFYTPEAYDAGKAILRFQAGQIDRRVAGATLIGFYELHPQVVEARNISNPFQFIALEELQPTGVIPIPCVNASENISEVGEALCHAYPEAPFSITYCDRPGGKRSYSLRSRNGFDVSVVAKAFGGGGHPGAAGFTLDAPSVF